MVRWSSGFAPSRLDGKRPFSGSKTLAKRRKFSRASINSLLASSNEVWTVRVFCWACARSCLSVSSFLLASASWRLTAEDCCSALRVVLCSRSISWLRSSRLSVSFSFCFSRELICSCESLSWRWSFLFSSSILVFSAITWLSLTRWLSLAFEFERAMSRFFCWTLFNKARLSFSDAVRRPLIVMTSRSRRCLSWSWCNLKESESAISCFNR